MADTQRSLAAILALLADNSSGAISPQDTRDAVVSLVPPHGQVYQIGNATATTISDTTSYFAVSFSGTSLLPTPYLFDSPASGQLRYIGVSPRMLHIACSISFTAAGTNQVIYLDLAQNGTVGGQAQVRRKVNTGSDVGSTALHWIVNVVQNDVIALYARNTTSASNITVENINLQAVGMIM